MKYKLLIIDADDTLYDFSKAEKYALVNAMNDLKIDVNEEYHVPLYREINIAIWEEFERGEITQQVLKVERFRRFLEAANMNYDAKAFSISFMDHLADAEIYLEGAVELVQRLSKKYRMVIVTNGLTRVQKYRVRQAVIAPYFERVIISEEIGYAKPDPMIFVEGLKGVELPPKPEMVMIGDTFNSDIMAGINYGIDTIWMNQKGKKNTSKYSPTYEVHSLEELESIL